MWRLLLLAAIAASCVPYSLATAQDNEIKTNNGRVSEVTVYQGQALVTRTVDLKGSAGLAEVVVSELPEYVIPSSIYAEPVGEGVEIRSVRYRVRPMQQDVRDEVRELDARIKTLSHELDAAQRAKSLLEQRVQYLAKLENFLAGTAKSELESGVLNAETLKQLTEFVFTERDEIGVKDLELTREAERLQSEVDVLQRERNQIAAGSATYVREAVVFVNATGEGPVQLKLNYLVSNATWSPSYNLRTTDDRKMVTVEYNAAIEQLSGEDWNDVAMTLSTATPSLVSSAPSLDPLVVALSRAVPETAQVAGQSSSAVRKSELAARQRALANNRGNFSGGEFDGDTSNVPAFAPTDGAVTQRAAAPADGLFGGMGGGGRGGSVDKLATVDAFEAAKQVDSEINKLAEQLQVIEYNTARFETKKDEGPRTMAGEGISVSYRLANSLTLPSRSDKQLLQISSRKLSGEFYRVATPVLTSFVYEECLLTNDTGDVMLAGPSSTFVGGQFVGRGTVPMVAAGESFRVGLGIDTSLRATRSLVDKSERISGGNRVVDFTYELAVENFGDSATSLRLLDRMPTSKQTDMKITLVKSDKPVSDDPVYQLKGLDEGLLRWDVEVPEGAMGPQRFVLKYTMQMEYDKQLAIESQTVAP
jgi:hypothetical protein